MGRYREKEKELPRRKSTELPENHGQREH
ncbi:unnamed protein product [Gulo gulo]|uniref:Uncharacterized protein n=1 Tax=Gulo gulo TaxID=48420 RepID=A0A9X9M2J0_GULGU|nr:unnamed protein product [Gulo gulo]